MLHRFEPSRCCHEGGTARLSQFNLNTAWPTAKLSLIEKRKLEKLFEMERGYVLDFSDTTMANFFLDAVQADTEDRDGYGAASKANLMRAFWRIEPSTASASSSRPSSSIERSSTPGAITNARTMVEPGLLALEKELFDLASQAES